MNIRFALHENDPSYIPVKAYEEDACYDVFARTFAMPDDIHEQTTSCYLAPGERCLVRTGVYLEMTPGWEALVRPRSGNALRDGLTVLNTPGTIDCGFRNEVGVILYNAGQVMMELTRGMKIAQVAFRRIPDHQLERIDIALYQAETERGLGGFGSSGR